MNQDDEELITWLHRTLGDAYIGITRATFLEYRVVSIDPVRLRRRNGDTADEQVVKIDLTGPRYAYIKAAIQSPRDTFDKIGVNTVKYNAYRDMLMYYHCAWLAYKSGITSLVTYFPSEIERVCNKYPNVFRVEKSNPPSPKAIVVHVLSPGDFNIEELDKLRPIIEDQFAFSQDVNPKLTKPIAAEPPHVEKQRADIASTTQPVNWETIKDIEDDL